MEALLFFGFGLVVVLSPAIVGHFAKKKDRGE